MNKLAPILVAWLLIGALPAFAAEQAGTGVTWESLDESTQDLLAGQKRTLGLIAARASARHGRRCETLAFDGRQRTGPRLASAGRSGAPCRPGNASRCASAGSSSVT